MDFPWNNSFFLRLSSTVDYQRLFQAMCVPLLVVFSEAWISRGLVVLDGRAVGFLCNCFLYGMRLNFGLPAFVPRFGRPRVLVQR